MILEVLADAGSVGDDIDAVLPSDARRADAGQHQYLRRVDRGGGDDHLAFCLNDLNRLRSWISTPTAR
jgi:hypothetical protein